MSVVATDPVLQVDRRKDYRVRKTLRYSLHEGAFSAAMIGFGESFFAAYALFLKATTFQVGMLSALPQAIGSLCQFFSNLLIRRLGSRKKLVVWAALLQALVYIPVALVFFFGHFKVWHLIFFASLYWSFGMILSPSWNSWMGELVNENRRGAYFSRRTKITGMATFLALLSAGYILEQFAHAGIKKQYIGFTIIFAIAFASRIASVVFLSKLYEPRYVVPREAEFGFLDFLQNKEFTNYRTFVMYLGFMNLGVFLSAPFFTPYMLTDLKLSYITFTLVNASAIITKVLSMRVWGWATDRFGARRVLKLAGFLMPVVPVLWLASRDVRWLVAIQVYSGFVWGGFEIATISFIFDTTTPSKRATCVAYYNVISGFTLISGAMLGGFIVRYNHVFASSYLLVFLLSGVLRFGASFLLLGRLKEVRTVERIGYPQLFMKVIRSMPTMGLLYELIPFRREAED